jgi:hypothetical protein
MKDELVKTSGTYEKIRNQYKILVRKPKRQNHLEDVCLCERMIYKMDIK